LPLSSGTGTLGVQEAEHAGELLPINQDPIAGPDLIANLALVYAWAREKGPRSLGSGEE